MSNNIFIRPGNDGIVDIAGLNCSSVLYVKGKKFEDYISELVAGDQFEQGEIDEIRQIIQYLNTSGLTTEWVVGNNNINVELKTAITALETKLTRLDTTGLTASWVVNNDNRNATLKTRIDNNDTSIETLTTKTKYTATTNGENSALMGTGAVSPASHIINPSATSGADWNTINLIADSNRSYIRICDDTSVMAGIGGEFRDEIVIHNDTKVRIEGADVSLLGTLVNVGKSSNCDVAFPSVPISQPISLTGLAWDIATGTTPSFIIAKLIAQACLPNYTDVFGFKTALVSRDKYITTSKGIVIKDYTLYNLDAVNVLPVESTYIAHGDIAKNCVFGNQNYWSGSGAIELRVDDFGNIGSTTLNDKENKTNKIKVSNQNVEIRSNNGSAGNIVLHNGCVNGGIQFRKGIDGTDAVSNTAMEIITPAGAAWHLTSQVVIGADTRTAVAQTEIYQAKSKLIVDTTSFSFTGTGKTGIHGIQVSNNKAYGDSGTGVDHTYVDPANVSSKSFTLQNNYTGTTTKTLYINNSDQLMYNGQLVGAGCTGGGSGGGTTFILTNATSVTNTSPINTLTTTYTSTAKTTITRNAYANNTTYAMGEFKSGYILSSTNLVLAGSYTADLFGLLTANQPSYLFSKLYHIVERGTPSTQFIVDKSLIYTSGSNSTNYQILYTKPIPVPVADISITLYQVVIPQLFTISSPNGSELITLTLRLISKNSAGTETTQYTFPTQTATIGNQTADRTFIASGGVTIDIFSLTSYYFKLTLTDDFTQGSVMRQALMRSDTDIVYKLAATTKTLIYNGTTNRTTLTNGVSTIYQLEMPFSFSSYDISDYTDYSKIQLEPFFIQPSGSTGGHSFVLSFQDGALSHLSTSISSVGASTLAQVLTAGNTANTSINMNSNNITNVGTIAPTAITGWNVKNISGGSGISVANSSGTITISATASANDSEPAMLISAAAALPSKPFWYNTIYSWLYSSSNVLTSDNYLDNCVSNTGQYQLIISSDRIRSSVDWGVTWGNTAFTSFSLNGVCITGSGNRYYINGSTRVFYFDATYSTFGSGASYLTSFPTLSGSLSYTRMKCSQDGKYILVGGGGGYATIYQSNDYGFTSTQQNTQGALINIDDVAMSADGKYQFLMFRQTGGIAGRVMYSTNYGVTFSSPTMPAGVSYTLIRVACSATGQYVVTTNQSIGILFSTDYGKNYLASGITGTHNFIDICMSANGQFVLAITYTQVFFSEDYGRSFLTATGTLTGATPFLQTIACSATAGYACVAGDGGRTWVIYDTPTDVRQLSAGSNVSITPNGFGTYTIAASSSLAVEQLAFYVGTFVLATGGNTITLPNSIDLDVYSVEIVLEGLLAQSGSSNTFFTIYYNGKFTGKTTWTNQIHGNGEFVAAGDYPQSYNNPVFAYVPQYAGTSAMPSGSIQYFSSIFDVSKHPDTTYSRSPIITNFRTSIGCDSGGSKITSNGAFQYQVGCIQGDTLNSSPNPLPTLSTILIGQYAAPNGPAGSFRSSLSGSPVQMLIYLKKKNVG